MLKIEQIVKVFNPGTVNEKVALNGLTLHLEDGDFCTVIGGNGAGKSTMLNAVAGVFPVDSGSIIIDGVDVTKLSEHTRAKYIGRVFQDPMTGTAATMQIEENLALAQRRGKTRSLKIGITKAERARYRELLKLLDLGLEDRLTSKVGLLSGGQRQALTLLMASLVRPKLLLLDEHTAIAHGNRLIMMKDGRIILDIRGEEKKKLTVEDLLEKFNVASGEEFANDRMILG